MNEPCRLTLWTPKVGQISGQLFTCSRPGRSLGSKRSKISDEYVHAWVSGLPPSTEGVIVVSLLGCKEDGLSEFSYYSFRGGFDTSEERPGCPTFQEWLDLHYQPGRFCLYEYPTTDLLVPSDETKAQAVATIRSFLGKGRTVIVVDSGGVGRSGNIATAVAARLQIKFLERRLRANCP